MAMFINVDECTGCGDCEPICPTQSIKSHKGLYVIDADLCTECEGEFDAPQCAVVCEIDDCILPRED